MSAQQNALTETLRDCGKSSISQVLDQLSDLETVSAREPVEIASLAAQAEAVGLLLTCLKSVSESQIQQVLSQLTTTEADQLMQLVYSGLAQGQASVSHVMFRWHEHVVSAFGAGCIMRTLTSLQA